MDVLAPLICTTVMDVLTTGVSGPTFEGATRRHWWRQEQCSCHCAYETELAEQFVFSTSVRILAINSTTVAASSYGPGNEELVPVRASHSFHVINFSPIRSRMQLGMSALPPEADMLIVGINVC